MSTNPSKATDAKPTHEQIAIRAELLWKAKGSPEGRDEEIWLEAERQLYDEAKEIISSTPRSESSNLSSEEPNPAMGSQSSAAEEMKPPSATAAKTGSRKRSSR
jgi:hypothetical protein